MAGMKSEIHLKRENFYSKEHKQKVKLKNIHEHE